jgi:hypothetical protein
LLRLVIRFEGFAAMKFQNFRCAVCKAAPTVLGFACLCAGPATREVESFAPESLRIVMRAPENMHQYDPEFKREIFARPVAAITTSHVGTAKIVGTGDIALGFGAVNPK